MRCGRRALPLGPMKVQDRELDRQISISDISDTDKMRKYLPAVVTIVIPGAPDASAILKGLK
jgi:hypothetical protein